MFLLIILDFKISGLKLQLGLENWNYVIYNKLSFLLQNSSFILFPLQPEIVLAASTE